MSTETGGEFELPGTAHVGRVALRVGSVERVRPFYEDVVGLDVERDGDGARLAAGGETLLDLREDAGAPERGREEAGLYHVAVRVPTRGALADTLSRIRGSEADLTGASDHLASEALYLRDPEGNGVEIYRDRPREEWPWTDDGGVAIDTLPLDLDDLAAEGRGGEALPPGTDVGHVHLEVADLDRSEGFYRGTLGLRPRARYGDEATFLAAGDYHHHVGLNVWANRSAPASGGRGLDHVEFVLPDAGIRETVRERVEREGRAVEERDGELVLEDPDGIELRLSVEG